MPFPFTSDLAGETADSVAHIIQTALTPVFMLSGIGTLLNLFNTRLARVSDHLEQAADLQTDEADADARRKLERHLVRLHRRTILLDISIMFGAVGGAATCGAAFALFLGSVRDSAISAWLVALFGIALLCTVAALAAFLLDSVFAWHGLRLEGPLPRKKPGGN
jgi:hypothetical protein